MKARERLSSTRIEVDEIWGYVGKKQLHMTALDDHRRLGDQYTFVALDPETKIVPAYPVGKRDLPTATAGRRRNIGAGCRVAEAVPCGAGSDRVES